MTTTQIKTRQAEIGGYWRRASLAERAGYIEEMVREMERLAAGPEFDRLRDLLQLARSQARRQALGED